MATVAKVMNHAAQRCSLRPPADWITNETATYSEMKSFLIETAEELLDRLDLPDPITKPVRFTGDGTDQRHALPSDFKRLTRDEWAVYEPFRNRRKATQVHSNAAWEHLALTNTGGSERFFRLTGDEGAGFAMSFWRYLEPGSEISASYVSKNWLRNPATDASPAIEVDEWTVEAAQLLLPDVLVRLGVIWRFKQKKGLPHADALAEYEMRISRAINDAQGIRKISAGDNRPRDWRPEIPDIITV